MRWSLVLVLVLLVLSLTDAAKKKKKPSKGKKPKPVKGSCATVGPKLTAANTKKYTAPGSKKILMSLPFFLSFLFFYHLALPLFLLVSLSIVSSSPLQSLPPLHPECPCWWDITRNDCACCKKNVGAMQCG